ncbi:MAG: matrixin family metalloprotease [Bdellovibrionota bacterium]
MRYFYGLLVLSLLAFSSTTRAYVFSTNSSGAPLRWPAPVQPTFYANWTNISGLTHQDVFNSFTIPLQRWKNIGSAPLSFDYYQAGTHTASWGFDGVNAIFFASQAPNDQKMGGSTIGVTYVFSSSGTILETDLEFNDEAFAFSTNPTHSSQFGNGSQVFLQNVATHEFGHAYGLSHSAVLHSSMVFLEDRGQARPSCDDIQAMGAAYGTNSFGTARGSISGSVQTSGATAVFGAHVLAVSKSRGTVIAGALSDSSGSYVIPNLEPGDYYLMVEPFQTTAPLSALCGGSAAGCSFGSINSSTVCAGPAPFKRVFIEGSVGLPTRFTVSAGTNVLAGVLTVPCAAMTEPWGVSVTSAATAPVLLSNNAGAEAQASARGVISGSGTQQYFRLSNVSGNISVKLLSYGLYSPFDARVAILDSSGNSVAAGSTSTEDAFSNESSFVNYDASATLNSAAAGDYYIRVTNAGNLAASPRLYPAGAVGVGGLNPQIDRVPYYLLLVTLNDSTTLLPSTADPLLANNPRCEASDDFAAFPDKGPGAPSPGRSLASSSGSAGSSTESSSKGCGVIYNVNDDDFSNGPRPSALAQAFSNWGLLILMIAFWIGQRLARVRVAR